ncbi:hypothetical protein ACH5RR_021333 [Cinchona calisaya]|uniref:Uncharacterized protein n=1 Tax=Cinchona calisaya TaxID=153742 RepID=A0ABD2ZH15_9GENT
MPHQSLPEGVRNPFYSPEVFRLGKPLQRKAPYRRKLQTIFWPSYLPNHAKLLCLPGLSSDSANVMKRHSPPYASLAPIPTLVKGTSMVSFLRKPPKQPIQFSCSRVNHGFGFRTRIGTALLKTDNSKTRTVIEGSRNRDQNHVQGSSSDSPFLGTRTSSFVSENG